jgi:hypothetical protein
MKWSTLTYALLFSGLGLFSYFLIVNYTDFSPQAAELLYSWGAFVFTILAFNLVGYFTLWVSGWVNKQYVINASWKWKIGMLYAVVIFLFLMLNYGLFVTAKILANAEPVFSFSRSGWNLLIVVWLAEMVVIGLLLSNRTLQTNWLLRQEATKLQMENTQAKYIALQNQLNPHFLFNSLNTLIAEIKYNPDNAMHFTRNLSSVYRYVLQCQGRNLVSLKEELEFMHSYLFLHKVRLGNCIDCDCRIPSWYMDRQIPPLTLQLLVENVIKHNSISSSKPMTVHIAVDNEYLLVSNTVSPKKKEDVSSGIGLKNLANRCRLMTDRDIFVEKENSVFTVKIPIIQ